MQRKMEQRKRLGNFRTKQKAMLADFMGAHPELRRGKFTSTFTHKSAQQLWESLTAQLNQTNGARKD